MTIYEHPWVYKYFGMLQEHNVHVYKYAPYVAVFFSFSFMHKLMIADLMRAFVCAYFARFCLLAGPMGVNPINVTAAKIELVRLVRSDKKDAVANFVRVTNM